MYEVLKKAKDEGNETWLFYGNDNPVCPHCGVIFNLQKQEADNIYEEGEHEIDCAKCGQPFRVTTRIQHLFDTDEQPREY